MRSLFFLGIFLLLAIPAITANLDCELIQENLWFDPLGWIKTCLMETKTSISSPDTKLSSPRDTQMRGLMFSKNEKISFLPVNVAENFPNLIAYGAWGCGIREISRENFKFLFHLRHLSLDGNQFETIPFDTFEDLILLEKLWLNNSNIKQLNGQAFVKLNSLDFILLNSNPCIDEDFFKPIDSLESIDEKCGFCESALSALIIESLEAELNAVKTDQPTSQNSDELENLRRINAELSKDLKMEQKENGELRGVLEQKETEVVENRVIIDRLKKKLEALDKIIHED